MEKYLIAVIRPNFTECLADADDLRYYLRTRGISSTAVQSGKDMALVKTTKGTIEFIPSNVMNNEQKLLHIVTGKRYTNVFGVAFLPKGFKEHVKTYSSNTDYINWILKKEKEYLTYTGLLCERCKNFPICAIKEEYANMQSAINSVMDTSEHFKKAKLECEYFVSNSPIFPCGCV